jgi:signal transduction histidine kinase
MARALLTILLVEDNPDDVEALQHCLREGGKRHTLIHCETLGAGLERLAAGGVDVVLLDLSLPDSHGHKTVIRAVEAAGEAPVVVLTGLDDERVGAEAVQAGAQDYLVKGAFDSDSLNRAIRYAIERQKMRQRQAATAARWAAVAEENARLAEALGRSNQLTTRFAATMSHELRSTLSAIINLTEILTDHHAERSRARHEQVVRLVRQTALESLQVLDATIELSRTEANRQPQQESNVALQDILAQLQSEIAPPQKVEAAQLEWYAASDLPTLRVDPVKVKMILRNLVSNAIRFTPQGKISIAARRDGDSVEIAVSDTGQGIAAEHLPHLFEPFSQVSPATHGGGGLGLYIVQRLVQLLGGTVAVESHPGQGSRFSVRLPVKLSRA